MGHLAAITLLEFHSKSFIFFVFFTAICSLNYRSMGHLAATTMPEFHSKISYIFF